VLAAASNKKAAPLEGRVQLNVDNLTGYWLMTLTRIGCRRTTNCQTR
jgi:hypothetical protein